MCDRMCGHNAKASRAAISLFFLGCFLERLLGIIGKDFSEEAKEAINPGMKTLLAVILLAAVNVPVAWGQTRIVQLRATTVKELQANGFFSIRQGVSQLALKTNEMMTVIRHYSINDQVNSKSALTWFAIISDTTIIPDLPVKTGDVLAGPLTLQLTSGNPATLNGDALAVALIQITTLDAGPVSPQSALVQPAGTAGKLSLQTSTNLVDWVEISPGNFTKTDAHRFFRAKLDLGL
jgi:hypothetical protein